MTGLIDNVLDFARGRLGGGISLNGSEKVSLEPLLQHVIDELHVGAPERIMETHFSLATPIRCDSARISQLASNLLGNALTHGNPKTPIRIEANSNEDQFTLSVINGGQQIPDAAMERLFHPFFRGEVRSSQQGLGLGLHIASQIAKAHGGEIEVVSTPIETRFTFNMPVNQMTS